MKWIALLMGVIFLIFGILQYNDQDAWVWMLIYFYIAIICFFAFLKRFNNLLLIVSSIAFLIASIVMFPEEYHGVTGNMNKNIYIEQAREALGVGIGFLIMLFNIIFSIKTKRNN